MPYTLCQKRISYNDKRCSKVQFEVILRPSEEIVEDEIGPKLQCFMCSQHYYYF